MEDTEHDRRGCTIPVIAWVFHIRTPLWPIGSAETSARLRAHSKHARVLDRARASLLVEASDPMASRDRVGGRSGASGLSEERRRADPRKSAARADSLRPLAEREMEAGIRPRQEDPSKARDDRSVALDRPMRLTSQREAIADSLRMEVRASALDRIPAFEAMRRPDGAHRDARHSPRRNVRLPVISTKAASTSPNRKYRRSIFRLPRLRISPRRKPPTPEAVDTAGADTAVEAADIRTVDRTSTNLDEQLGYGLA